MAFAIPIYLRWRQGDSWVPGHWNLGNKYKWIAPLAVDRDRRSRRSTSCSRPFRRRVPCHKTDGVYDFTWAAVNYTPIVVFGVLIAITIWWLVSAKNWFKGPKTTIDLPEGVSAADELAAEAHGGDLHTHGGGTPPA